MLCKRTIRWRSLYPPKTRLATQSGGSRLSPGNLRPPPISNNRIPYLGYTKQIPLEIKAKKAERALFITWDDGRVMKYPYELLRVESPSAEVQGHGAADQKRLVWGKKNVGIIGIEPQGNYAVSIKFDDGHDTGIYAWQYLYYLGSHKYSILKQYLKDLRAAGKHRDPRTMKHSPPKNPAQTPPPPHVHGPDCKHD